MRLGDGKKARKKVWWISIGRYVLQTSRFWESLVGVDNFNYQEVDDVLSHARSRTCRRRSFGRRHSTVTKEPASLSGWPL